MQTENENNRLNNIIETALKNLNGLIDVNTVVGKSIKTEDGDCIIPVSKVTFGVLSGGGEYGKINVFKKDSEFPYSAGNGAIVSVKPCAFLIKDSNNEYKVLSVKENMYEGLLEKANDLIEKLNKEN